MIGPAAALEARDLACSRGFARLFHGLSFRVSAGEWAAVRGANGSGKTTLLRCVAGLTRADSGEVVRCGDILYAGHLAGVKDDMSAEENLRGMLALHGVVVVPGRLIDALARAGLERIRHLQARRLSAGQRRRIGLARLMLDPAPVWILDEPLTALDEDGERLFANLLGRHLERGGLGLFATHHDLAPAPARELHMGMAS
ncbi:MAG TPA: heme ABC exporter ATP-binding protein CcmA [Usitatibacter sp.]|nr:heme ABC exporter ATP-binding protein CcmA [Usitatibacter sp.]